MIKKISSFFLIILLFLIFGEMFLIFLINKSGGKTVFPTPTPSGLIEKRRLNTPIKKATLDNVTSSLVLFSKNILQSSIITNTYTGKISEINTKGSKDKNYPFLAKITLENNNDLDSFYFYKDHFSIMKVYKTNNDGKLIPYNLDSLRVGDYITIKESTDITKDWLNSYTELQIIKNE